MLERAIRSTLNQSYADIDVIVVDDNGEDSPDSAHTQSVVDAIGDPRVRLIKNKTNVGGAEARNVGIRESKGQYVAFLDDDDEYMPNKIEESVLRFEALANENLALVYGFALSLYEDGAAFLNANVNEGWCPDLLLQTRGLAATSQWVCRRSALADVGGFTDSPAKQDSILMLKLFISDYEIACVEKPLSLYYEHSEGRISTSRATIDGEKNLQELGRTLYDRFDEATIDRIECSFEFRLAFLYFEDGLYMDCFRFFRAACARDFSEARQRFILPAARLLKARVANRRARRSRRNLQ